MTTSVLVVEKDPLTRETITYMLEAMKYTAVGVEDGKAAMDVLDAVHFHVMIVSLAIDDPDGVTIAESAKANQSGIKVIVVSGKRAPDHLNFCVDEFVQKPFSLGQIRDAITRVLPLAA